MSLTVWIVFIGFVLGLLALDLGVFHRRAHTVEFREAMGWTAVWIALSLLFNLGVYYYAGPQKALEFLTAYLIEKSLSVDNIFVFLVIFTSFGVETRYQHRILFWGIIGALILRGCFIAAGVALIHQYHWLLYLFGIGLIYTGFKMGFKRPADAHSPKDSKLIPFLRKVLPVSEHQEEGHFFVHAKTGWQVTPLFIVLLLIEASDAVFALDSIPAILAISLDPFIVFTSNVFAILGLRALYFALAGILPKFYYLHHGLSVIIVWVGLKMLFSDIFHFHILVTLGVVAVVLIVAIVASWLRPPTAHDVAIPKVPMP